LPILFLHITSCHVLSAKALNYFEAIGTPILRGRPIDERDAPTSGHVAVINQAFARRYFQNEDPIGKHFGMLAEDHGEYEVVGVVQDAKYTNARESAEPMFFLPFFQVVDYKDPQFISGEIRSNYINDIELRIAVRMETAGPLLRRTMASIDPNLPVTEIRTLDDQIGRNVSFRQACVTTANSPC
jgi:MacB-like protein